MIGRFQDQGLATTVRWQILIWQYDDHPSVTELESGVIISSMILAYLHPRRDGDPMRLSLD
jgi:hypothetical protein